jgi:hypothetical protein
LWSDFRLPHCWCVSTDGTAQLTLLTERNDSIPGVAPCAWKRN